MCLRISYAPKCICLLSRWPYYSVYREWLYEIYRKAVNFKLTIPLENYISNFVMEVPLPPPRNIKVKFSIGEKWAMINRPPPSSLPLADVRIVRASSNRQVPFSYTFKSLGISNVLTFFKCILLEQKVLLYLPMKFFR